MRTKGRGNIDLPLLWDAAAWFGILCLYGWFSSDIAAVSFSQLCGDTADLVRQAYVLITHGRLDHVSRNWSFESDFFCLTAVPVVLLFKNTVACLQVNGVLSGMATVTVLYVFLRRAYGLAAAVGLGLIFATSPLLLGHNVLHPELFIPCWIGIILIAETMPGKRVRFASAFAAGLFTSVSPYFLFPYFGYLVGRTYRRWPVTRDDLRQAVSLVPAFLLGLLPLAHKYVALPETFLQLKGDSIALWRTSVPGGLDPGAALGNLWTQVSWSLDSLWFYGPAAPPALLTPLVLGWLSLMICGAWYMPSRRWVITLIAGLVPAALIVSPNGGLGMRHLVAFLPFFWLPLAPLIARPGSRVARSLLLAVAAAAALHYAYIARSFVSLPAAGPDVFAGMQYLRSVCEYFPHHSIYIYTSEGNLPLLAGYCAPEKNIVTVSLRPGTGQGLGNRVVLVRGMKLKPHARFRKLKSGQEIDGTTYDIYGEI